MRSQFTMQLSGRTNQPTSVYSGSTFSMGRWKPYREAVECRWSNTASISSNNPKLRSAVTECDVGPLCFVTSALIGLHSNLRIQHKSLQQTERAVITIIIITIIIIMMMMMMQNRRTIISHHHYRYLTPLSLASSLSVLMLLAGHQKGHPAKKCYSTSLQKFRWIPWRNSV